MEIVVQSPAVAGAEAGDAACSICATGGLRSPSVTGFGATSMPAVLRQPDDRPRERRSQRRVNAVILDVFLRRRQAD